MLIKKPFVTFIVMAYNAERFIEEAVQSAFNQDYSNLEIIISDDASTDRTFEIIQQLVAEYNGPLKENIRAIRNEQNLGLAKHLNKLWWHEAKGDWIIVNAGDDISEKNRTTYLVNQIDLDTTLIYHGIQSINADSVIFNESDTNANLEHIQKKNLEIIQSGSLDQILNNGAWVLGATMMFSKKIMDRFPPFLPNLINEDNVQAYRAKYLGQIKFVSTPLMRYRRHEGSLSTEKQHKSTIEKKKSLLKVINNKIAYSQQILMDYEVIRFSSLLSNRYQKELFWLTFLLRVKILPYKLLVVGFRIYNNWVKSNRIKINSKLVE